MIKVCPGCGEPVMGAMYFGLPGWICMSDEHDGPVADGPGPTLALWLGLYGGLITYPRGQYWSTLWRWLTGQL